MDSSKKSAVARASEDFMPREPTLQTLHIVSVSFNSLFLGEVVAPDWDMFQVSVLKLLDMSSCSLGETYIIINIWTVVSSMSEYPF